MNKVRGNVFAGAAVVRRGGAKIARRKMRRLAWSLSLLLAGLGTSSALAVNVLPWEFQNIDTLATTNANAADTTNADQLRTGGGLGLTLDGTGVKVGVWDGGAIRSTHVELAGKITIVDAVALSDHSTHVAGTIAATGINAAAAGMAPGVTIRSRDFNNDTTEMAADAPLLNLSNHSYSFIRGWRDDTFFSTAGHPGALQAWYGDRTVSGVEDIFFGQYSTTSSSVDSTLASNPNLLSVWAASNDRNDVFLNPSADGQYIAFFSVAPGAFLENLGGGFYRVSAATGHVAPAGDGNGGTGYDSLPNGGQTAKNSLVVGAALDHLTDPHVGATMATTSFSSYGATDDGRLGVHVIGNGNALTSSIATGDANYASFSGTSMAAPNVTGTAALLHEHYTDLTGSLTVKSATQKGYLVHTATDYTNAAAGGTVGPDYATGYGMVNGAAAAGFLTDAITTPIATRQNHLFETSLANSSTFSLLNLMAVGGEIKATLVWTDAAHAAIGGFDNATSALVNDLDLWLEDGIGNIFRPWILDGINPANAATTGINSVDNIEQVLTTSLAGNPWKLFIDHKGTLAGGLQNFSLLLSGVTIQQAVAADVPEPATALLGLLGAGALLRRRRLA